MILGLWTKKEWKRFLEIETICAEVVCECELKTYPDSTAGMMVKLNIGNGWTPYLQVERAFAYLIAEGPKV